MIRSRNTFRRGAELGVLPETAALLAKMTTMPDASRIELIDKTISDLIDDGLWSQIDAMWFFAAHDIQPSLLEWKNPERSASTEGSPTYTVDRGWESTTTSEYIETGVHLLDDVSKFTDSQGSAGIYINTPVNTTTNYFSAGNNLMLRNTGLGSGTIRGSILDSAFTDWLGNHGSNLIGLLTLRRVESNRKRFLINGSQVSNVSRDIAGTLAGTMRAGQTGARLAFLFFGAGMTPQNHEDLYEIVQNYMEAVGADV